MPDNTAQSWGEALLALALEAEHDAGQHGTDMALHEQLKDLSLVLTAHAHRLGVEKPGPAREDERVVPMRGARRRVVGGGDVAESVVETFPGGQPPIAPQVAFPEFQALADRVAALEATERAGGVPHWIVEALGAIGDRLDEHERRIIALEERANFDTVQPGSSYVPEERIIEDPTAWNSIEVARRMLSAMVVREWNKAIGIRGQLLSRTLHLARLPASERTADDEAELAQKSGMVVAQDIIDGKKARLLDEIAGLDDLDAARGFDVKSGWP